MHLLYVLLIAVLAVLVSSNKKIDITTLLDAYTLTCGQQFCYNHDHNLPDTSRYSYLCPYCSCDPTCFYNGNCCLDLFLSLNIECTNTTIISYFEQESTSIHEDFFVMRTSCPDSVDIDIKNQCEGSKNLTEQIQHLPVTSKGTHFTYKNKFCAECYHDLDIEYWSFSSICEEFVDVNFMSSFEDILQTAIIKKCKFGGFLKNTFVRGCDKNRKSDIISTCNVSGTWETYDPSIEWACMNYDNSYDIFRNVFCYICNPPAFLEPATSQCNKTGLWDGSDMKLTKACQDFGFTSTTYPFKNIFCYICNVPFDKTSYEQSKDAYTFSAHSVYKERYFKYKFQIDYILDQTFLSGLYDDNNILDKKEETNVKEDIYLQYYAMTGNGHFCTNVSSLIQNDGSCSCDEYCHFDKTTPCCIDRVFKQSTQCISSSSDNFLVYDGCERAGNGFGSLYDKCVGKNDNLLYDLPVHDYNTNVDYKNIFCGLCRYFKDSSKMFIPYQFHPWTVYLVCEASLPFSYHVSLSELLDYRHQSRCTVSYEHRSCGKWCSKNSLITSCSSGANSSLEYACQNYNLPPFKVEYYNKMNNSSLKNYPNIFCAMCNNTTTGLYIGSCNITGDWDKYNEQIEQKCLILPQLDYHYPFKNIFCKICNTISRQYDVGLTNDPGCLPGVIENEVTHIRSLFSLFLYDDSADLDSPIERCNKHKVYDTYVEQCRDIGCFPGRVLINDRCLPVLPFTSNIGYIIAFGVDIFLTFAIETPVSFLGKLRNEIWNQIKLVGGFQYPFKQMSIISVNIPCNDDFSWTVGHIHISVFMKMFSVGVVDRSKVEQNLFKFMQTNFTFYFPCSKSTPEVFCSSKCILGFDENAFHLPSRFYFASENNECSLKEELKIQNTNMYVFRRISSLLECPQIQLEADEIQVTYDKTKVRILRSGAELNYYEFFFIKENAIRICLSKFYDIVKATKQEKTPVIQTVILICTTLSLGALLFTFVTYCMFPSLRTLPGKNNMSLVFALFCAYTFLEFGIERTENQIGCMMLGICIHFFWLSTFGCVNVCSFHMFRTFRQNFIFQSYDQERDRKRFALYNLYSYGVPLLFVGLNVIISNRVIDNQSYGYGGKACFISHQLTVLCTFIAPVALICLVNLVLFIFTAISIASTPKACATDSFSQNKIQFSVYVKLFILTGGSWILQILDSIFPSSVFSILVSSLNSFQGIYIFFAYICNHRVFNLYKSLTEQKQIDNCKTDQRIFKSNMPILSTVSATKYQNDKEVDLGQSNKDERILTTNM